MQRLILETKKENMDDAASSFVLLLFVFKKA